MVDVLPEWTVRGVKSSECVERKDGSDRCSESDRKETDVFERHSNPNRCTGSQTLHAHPEQHGHPISRKLIIIPSILSFMCWTFN